MALDTPLIEVELHDNESLGEQERNKAGKKPAPTIVKISVGDRERQANFRVWSLPGFLSLARALHYVHSFNSRDYYSLSYLFRYVAPNTYHLDLCPTSKKFDSNNFNTCYFQI